MARSSSGASREIESMQQKAREELEKARVASSQDSQSVTEEIRMKERAKMQTEVKKVQEELDKVLHMTASYAHSRLSQTR